MTKEETTLLHAVTRLKGVGPRQAEKLQKLGIHSIQDLLFHLPFRYQDRTRLTPIGALQVGTDAVIEGDVEITQIKFARKRSLIVRLSDGTGAAYLRFFHFSRAQQEKLQAGTRLRCFGEVRKGAGLPELVHPEYQEVNQNNPVQLDSNLTPVYPGTEGLQQKSLRRLLRQAMQLLEKHPLIDYLPAEYLHSGDWPTLQQAISYIHQPPADAPVQMLFDGHHPSQQRLAFEELLAHQLSMLKLRDHLQQHPAPVFPTNPVLGQKLLASLAFKLTTAQQRVLDEIDTDLQQGHPMLRLLQGDVGCGKTIVAALTALQAIAAGYQVAIMAPTELLAEQHRQSFEQWLTPLSVSTIMLTSKQRAAERKKNLQALLDPTPKLVVGTHALFQDDVIFARLGLVIIDEQHRFGVHQRLSLRDKGALHGEHPHQLIMTATPIPRTLAMTAYADLDTSIIDELPPNRQQITTTVLPENRRDDVIRRIAVACETGRQIYWVCPLIEESIALECQAATDTAEILTNALPGIQVGLIHGRMKSIDKSTIMATFAAGEITLLVATTVIEVGVDVPNASLMIIENAERLGLAQLHQLRGRVGRGAIKSDCLLLYKTPLSQMARERLAIMQESNDGFRIAERDLELRGPGELLGTRQSGLAELRIANLQRDAALIPKAMELAPRLARDHPENIENLIHRWLGDAIQYGHV